VPSVATLTAFVVIVAAFAAAPGPSNLYVVAQGLRAGRRSALAAAAGCAMGAGVYVVATAIGLAAVLASSATALSVLHYVGGAYLLLLGVRALRARRASADLDGRASRLRGRALRQGLVVELGNPKVALFFLAFFPQFIHADRGATWSQVVVLGAVFCLVGLASDSLYAIASGTLQGRLSDNARLVARSRRASGALYLGLGAWAIASGSRTHAR
jgi:threonine/homoserine/homoserine lactone efflux protein